MELLTLHEVSKSLNIGIRWATILIKKAGIEIHAKKVGDRFYSSIRATDLHKVDAMRNPIGRPVKK